MFRLKHWQQRKAAAANAPAPRSTSAEKTPIAAKLKHLGIVALQLGVLIGVYGIGCFISSYLPITIPGNIIGMALLLVLLASGVLKAKHVGEACDYMLDNMSIFFIPAGVGIMGCFSLLQDAALKFAFVCVVTTVIVFLATSLTVALVSRLMERFQAHEHRGTSAARLNQEA